MTGLQISKSVLQASIIWPCKVTTILFQGTYTRALIRLQWYQTTVNNHLDLRNMYTVAVSVVH